MKKSIISFLSLLAVAAMFSSCHNGSMYQLTVEGLGQEGSSPVVWQTGTVLTMWDDAMAPVDVALAGVAPDSSYASIQMPEGFKRQGLCRFMYPKSAFEKGHVKIATMQSGKEPLTEIPCYAEVEEGASELAFRTLCGVLKLNLTTAEKLKCVRVETLDSLVNIAGTFNVNNYPYPTLEAVEGSPCIDCEAIQGMDFSQGAELQFFLAPGIYNTFNVIMVTEDGRVCEKNLKEGKHIEITRNGFCTIKLGDDEENKLVFE